MKRVLTTAVVVLAALAVMAPGPPDRAEQLRVDPIDWDIQPFYDDSSGAYLYGVALSGIECRYGLATAGEHADFNISVTLSGVRIDDNSWDLSWTETVLVGFHRDPDAAKDADGYIAIITDLVSWNGDDDGSGYVVNEVALSLIGPSGLTVGEAVTTGGDGVIVSGPTFGAPVMIDTNGWDYDPDLGEIIVPLLASSNLVDELAKGYSVVVSVDVVVLDASGAIVGSGSGQGSTAIVKIEDIDFDYVSIQPLHASSVDWNGDDDGTGIVNGTLTLIAPSGDVMGTWVMVDLYVSFGSACGEDCPPES